MYNLVCVNRGSFWPQRAIYTTWHSPFISCLQCTEYPPFIIHVKKLIYPDPGAEATLLHAGPVLHRVETEPRTGRGHEGGAGRARLQRGGD